MTKPVSGTTESEGIEKWKKNWQKKNRLSSSPRVSQKAISATSWSSAAGSAAFRPLSISPTAGFKVYLVEKSPAIGGKMAQLDKTFPTNDCSMCIESPKFIECSRHPNIEILTYTEVESVEGEAGDFKVTLIKKPRYIEEDKCTGCGVCVEYCPVKVPDQYNQDLSLNKAIHIYFSQAVPLVTYIDLKNAPSSKRRNATICAGCLQEQCDRSLPETGKDRNRGRRDRSVSGL